MRFRCCWVVLWCVGSLIASVTNAADAWEAEIAAALERADENRAQIQTALDKIPAEQHEGMRFLVAFMPDGDLRKLSSDLLLENVEYAYRALNEAPWKDRVPKDVFLNYLLPYASIDERRDNWRKDFYERYKPLVAEITEPGKAGVKLNQKVFPLLGVRFSADRPKANQSPYETIEAKRASCTGLSVLLVDACRAVGVPARFVGTPLWADKSGNHSWVEIWDGNDWRYTGAAEPSGDDLDNGWFGGRAVTAQRDHPLHAIYAVRYEKTPQFFPPAWSRRPTRIYAVNVTDRYTKRAGKRADDEIVVRFCVLEDRDGKRLIARLKLTDSAGAVLAEGATRDDRFDPNDHLEVVVKNNQPLRVEIRALDRQWEAEIRPQQNEELFTYYLTDGQLRSPISQVLSPTESEFAESDVGKRLAKTLQEYFDAPPDQREKIVLDSEFDRLVLEQSTAVRKLAWNAYRAGKEATDMRADLEAHRVRYKQYECPYVVRAVGVMPADGWPLFIAMHGGGGAPAEVNDSQWRMMQNYYRDQSSVEGYLYLAIRAPNNTWNGFYDWYNLGLTQNLIRQFVAAEKVDPNKVFLMGYSHGGYGAFFQGPRMPDRFAAVHASASAPSGGNATGKNLRNTPFTFMVGEFDTAHHRLSMCREFESFINELRSDRTDIYPVTMEYKAGAPHSGLPDRDKIKELYPAIRDPVPRELSWLPSYAEVSSLSWLHLLEVTPGIEIEASCRDNVLTVAGQNGAKLHVYLDERLIDYQKPVTISVDGVKSKQTMKPSLRTLCETLAERGDPELMFATRWKVTTER